MEALQLKGEDSFSGVYAEENALSPDLAELFRDPKWGAQKLSTIALLKNFTSEELQKLYRSGEIRSYRSKTNAVIEGEPTRGLYIILVGTVSVYKNNLITGTMHRLAHLERGAYFGELSLFDTSPRAATVVAETQCHMFYLDVARFMEFLESSGSDAKIRFYKTCAEDLVNRFRVLNSDYISAQQLLWKFALRRDSEAPPSPPQVPDQK